MSDPTSSMSVPAGITPIVKIGNLELTSVLQELLLTQKTLQKEIKGLRKDSKEYSEKKKKIAENEEKLVDSIQDKPPKNEKPRSEPKEERFQEPKEESEFSKNIKESLGQVKEVLGGLSGSLGSSALAGFIPFAKALSPLGGIFKSIGSGIGSLFKGKDKNSFMESKGKGLESLGQLGVSGSGISFSGEPNIDSVKPFDPGSALLAEKLDQLSGNGKLDPKNLKF
jgi:hypothetical protein